MVNILFGNNKGGVGKTYVTVQMAHALASRGLKVAVVDLDPQANASRQLGWKFDPMQPVATISEAIQNASPGLASQVTVATQKWDGEETAIDLLPSRHDLENRISEAATVGAVRRLVKVLDGWQDEYDVVLIDTPPSLGHLTQLGLAAAHMVVCVTEPAYDAVEGAIRFKEFVEQHAADLANPNLRFGGVVVNRVQNVNEHKYQLEGFREQMGDLIFSPTLPTRIAAAEASAAAAPIAAWGTEHATTYAELAQAILSTAKEITA